MKNFFNKAINNQVSLSFLIFFIILLLLWIWMYFMVPGKNAEGLANWTYYFITIPFFGMIFSLVAFKRWGGFTTYMGKAFLFFSLGFLTQNIGNLIFIYLTEFIGWEIPYPSVSDWGFVLTPLFYGYGSLMLAKSCQAKQLFKAIGNGIYLVVLPFIVIAAAYVLLVQNIVFDWSNPAKIILDFTYHLGHAIGLSAGLLALVVSNKILGGAFNKALYLLIISFVILFLADYSYVYQANHDFYYPGGLSDMLYAGSYIFTVIGLIALSMWPQTLRGK